MNNHAHTLVDHLSDEAAASILMALTKKSWAHILVSATSTVCWYAFVVYPNVTNLYSDKNNKE